jgi:hypothetical protein
MEHDSEMEPPMSDSMKNLTVIQTPFCGDLQSKKFSGRIAQSAEEYLDASGHCWCYHTQQAVGPDGGLVEPETCVPGRKCYRSALEKPNKLV